MAPAKRVTMSRRVLAVMYLHAKNQKPYKHEFGPGVEMYAETDGTITLCKPGVDLAEDES